MANFYLVPFSKYKSTLKVVRPYIKAELHKANIGRMIAYSKFSEACKVVSDIHIRLFKQGYTCDASHQAMRDLRDTLLQYRFREDK